jgi:hypothetical protein
MMKSVRLCSVMLSSLLLINISFAQKTFNTSWRGGDGNWTNGALWTRGVPPNNSASSSYNVKIDTPNSSSSIVTMDQNAAINSLKIESHAQLFTEVGYSLTATSLDNAGSITNCSLVGYLECGENSINVSGGVHNSGTIQNNGNMSVGTVHNSGIWMNGGLAFLPSLTTTNISGDLHNTGSFSVECDYSPGCGQLGVEGRIYNSGSLTIVQGSVWATSITNTGDIGMAGPTYNSFLSTSGDFNNRGNFGSSWDTTQVGRDLINSGTMIFTTNDDLIVGRNLTNSGKISGAFHSFEIGGEFTNKGTFDASSYTSSTLVVTGTLNNSGSFVSETATTLGGTVQNSGTIDIPNFTQNGNYIEQFLTTSQFGTLNANSIELGGVLDFRYGDEFSPSLGQTFDIFTFTPGELDGAFSSLLHNRFNGGEWMFDVNYDNPEGRIFLTVVDAPTNTPEPSSLFLLVTGLAGLVLAATRQCFLGAKAL